MKPFAVLSGFLAVFVLLILGFALGLFGPHRPSSNGNIGGFSGSSDRHSMSRSPLLGVSKAVTSPIAGLEPATAIFSTSRDSVGETGAPISPRTVRPLPVAFALASQLDNAETPQAFLQHLETLVGLYQRAHNGEVPPVNENLELVRVLSGANSAGLQFLPAPEAVGVINQEGLLVDPWATPVVVHLVSRHHLEIRSAGPDRLPWTSDDVLARDTGHSSVRPRSRHAN